MNADLKAVNIMVDVETLGLTPGSVILSIGACVFDPYGTRGIGETFQKNICIDSAQRAGLTINGKTVVWWLGQSLQARSAMTADDDMLGNVLSDFSEWWTDQTTGQGPGLIWAWGANFDPGMLEAAYLAAGLHAPWRYDSVRCARTICRMAGIDHKGEWSEPDDVPHVALSDAKVQARMVTAAMRQIGLARS